MTESERIISEGIISQDFFKSEVRDDFLVDESRKKLWAIELDLLLKFDMVCKKYNLRYFLMYGSLLGAVRHKGFIPWDDDLDVCMPRSDYEKLLEIGKYEFKDPYFFQTPETDEGYYYTFAKIRNSNTSALIPLFKYQGFNMGILLDVFPLDFCDINEAEENYNKIQKLTRDNTTFMRMSNPNLSEADKERVKKYPGGNPMERHRLIQSIASKHEKDKSSDLLLSVSVVTIYKYDRQIFRQEDFADHVLWPFEQFEFPIPIGYDRVLRTIYGDYSKFPPLEERGKFHSDYVFDTDRSYREYLE